jgi:hypothetical protein
VVSKYKLTPKYMFYVDSYILASKGKRIERFGLIKIWLNMVTVFTEQLTLRPSLNIKKL